MRTPASIAGHPIHPMLVSIPIGLWIFALACDLVHTLGGGDPLWRVIAFYAIVGGIIGALAAAVPGLIDLLSLPAGPRRTAIIHMTLNLTIVVLFVINAWIRTGRAPAERVTILDTTVLLSIVAVGLLVASGWLGGKLVFEGGVGVNAVDTSPDQATRGGYPAPGDDFRRRSRHAS